MGKKRWDLIEICLDFWKRISRFCKKQWLVGINNNEKNWGAEIKILQIKLEFNRKDKWTFAQLFWHLHFRFIIRIKLFMLPRCLRVKNKDFKYKRVGFKIIFDEFWIKVRKRE